MHNTMPITEPKDIEAIIQAYMKDAISEEQKAQKHLCLAQLRLGQIDAQGVVSEQLSSLIAAAKEPSLKETEIVLEAIGQYLATAYPDIENKKIDGNSSLAKILAWGYRQKASGVQSLHLEWDDLHRLSPAKWKALGEALKCSGVVSLDLRNNNCYSLTPAPDQWKALGKALTRSGVQSLYLGMNTLQCLYPAKWKALGKALKCSGVVSLGLGWGPLNWLSHDQWKALGEALTLSGVQSLSLEMKNIVHRLSLDQWKVLCEALKCSGVVSLDLEYNDLVYLSPAKWKALGEALKRSRVVSLDLGDNDLVNLSLDQWKALCEALKLSGIQSLNLRENNLVQLSVEQRAIFLQAIALSSVTEILLDKDDNTLSKDLASILLANRYKKAQQSLTALNAFISNEIGPLVLDEEHSKEILLHLEKLMQNVDIPMGQACIVFLLRQRQRILEEEKLLANFHAQYDEASAQSKGKAIEKTDEPETSAAANLIVTEKNSAVDANDHSMISLEEQLHRCEILQSDFEKQKVTLKTQKRALKAEQKRLQKKIAQLQNTQKMVESDEQDIQQLQANDRSIQYELVILNDRLEEVETYQEILKRDRAVKERHKTNEENFSISVNQQLYYHYLQNHIETLFISAKAVVGGMTKVREGTLSQVFDGIGLLGKLIPVADAIKASVEFVLKSIDEKRQTHIAQRMGNYVTLSECKHLAILVAESLTRWYTPQLNLLATPEEEQAYQAANANRMKKMKNKANQLIFLAEPKMNAEKMVEFAVLLICEALQDNALPEAGTLQERLVQVVTDKPRSQKEKKRQKLTKPLWGETLLAKKKGNPADLVPWYLIDVYTKAGIISPNNFMYRDMEAGHDSTQYGYCIAHSEVAAERSVKQRGLMPVGYSNNPNLLRKKANQKAVEEKSKAQEESFQKERELQRERFQLMENKLKKLEKIGEFGDKVVSATVKGHEREMKELKEEVAEQKKRLILAQHEAMRAKEEARIANQRAEKAEAALSQLDRLLKLPFIQESLAKQSQQAPANIAPNNALFCALSTSEEQQTTLARLSTGAQLNG